MPSEMASSAPMHPAVEWAQRKDALYLTIAVEDCKEPNLNLTEDKLEFSGKGGPDKREFACVIEFYKPIDPSKVQRVASDRSLQFYVPKKETGPFWPRLLKQQQKVHWVKIDFNKWRDEDDEDDEGNMNWDLNEMMGKMGGGGFGGERPDLDDLGDSDNEELPDLEDDTPVDAGDKSKEKTADKNGETDASGDKPVTSSS